MDRRADDNQWLDAFDEALAHHVTTESTDNDQLRLRVIGHLNRQRRLRVGMPAMAFMIALALAGNQLWRLGKSLAELLPTRALLNGLETQTLLSSVQQVPIYAWVIVPALLFTFESVFSRR